jgi:hypothetical protein
MQQKHRPENWNMNLVPAPDAARMATLERMRGKLAGRSSDLALREDKVRRVRRGKTFAWGWRIALVALFFAANAALVDHIRVAPSARMERKAPSVPEPKHLAVNDQALYWTYALYDFDRLKAKFGAPANAVIDAGEAKARLRELLPKVDRRTRFTIDRYIPKGGIKA